MRLEPNIATRGGSERVAGLLGPQLVFGRSTELTFGEFRFGFFVYFFGFGSCLKLLVNKALLELAENCHNFLGPTILRQSH